MLIIGRASELIDFPMQPLPVLISPLSVATHCALFIYLPYYVTQGHTLG